MPFFVPIIKLAISPIPFFAPIIKLAISTMPCFVPILSCFSFRHNLPYPLLAQIEPLSSQAVRFHDRHSFTQLFIEALTYCFISAFLINHTYLNSNLCTLTPSPLSDKIFSCFFFLFRWHMSRPIGASLQDVFPMQLSDIESILQSYFSSNAFYWFLKCNDHISKLFYLR